MAVARRGAVVVILKYVYWWGRCEQLKTRLTSTHTQLPRREKKAHTAWETASCGARVAHSLANCAHSSTRRLSASLDRDSEVCQDEPPHKSARDRRAHRGGGVPAPRSRGRARSRADRRRPARVALRGRVRGVRQHWPSSSTVCLRTASSTASRSPIPRNAAAATPSLRSLASIASPNTGRKRSESSSSTTSSRACCF